MKIIPTIIEYKIASSHNFTLLLFLYKAEREQALRDYKVTIEYKHLKQHAPGGVYVLPSHHDLRFFHGVIFLRRGLYTNGIFKFTITLPLKYNDVNTRPQIVFGSHVYHPHVNEETGELDISVAYPNWDPHKHYLVTVLTYLKKIFYLKTIGDDAVANIEARDLSRSDPKAYRGKIQQCVRESQRCVYMNEPNCTVHFSEENACHHVLRDMMNEKITDPHSISRAQILECVEVAKKVGEARMEEEGKEEGIEAGLVETTEN